MNKYNNSKIYKIVSIEEPKYYYIGSTITDNKHSCPFQDLFINV